MTGNGSFNQLAFISASLIRSHEQIYRLNISEDLRRQPHISRNKIIQLVLGFFSPQAIPENLHFPALIVVSIERSVIATQHLNQMFIGFLFEGIPGFTDVFNQVFFIRIDGPKVDPGFIGK